jgi:hypothetical protein
MRPRARPSGETGCPSFQVVRVFFQALCDGVVDEMQGVLTDRGGPLQQVG